VSGLRGIRERLGARRWQRWTEVEPEDDYARRAGWGIGVALGLFVLVIVLVIVGLVFAR
jgi:hypothetical protein